MITNLYKCIYGKRGNVLKCLYNQSKKPSSVRYCIWVKSFLLNIVSMYVKEIQNYAYITKYLLKLLIKEF